jgi:hypothetical protein
MIKRIKEEEEEEEEEEEQWAHGHFLKWSWVPPDL